MAEISEENKKECTNVFNFLDKNQKGFLTPTECIYGLGVLGKELKRKEKIEIKNKENYSLEDFINLCIQKVDFNSVQDSMKKAFSLIETTGKPGQINKKDLIFILKKFNEKITDKDINDIVKEVGLDKSEYISIESLANNMLVK